MATNPPKGDNHRQGEVRDRSQTFNPKTEQWVKRDTDSGRFPGCETGRNEIQRRAAGASERALML